MLTIKLTTATPDWPIIQQTPGQKGTWGNCRFEINKDVPECDWWFVANGLQNPESTQVPKDHVVMLTGEPPTVKKYDRGFLRQFSTVLTCHTDMVHPHVIQTHTPYAWFVGRRAKGHVNIAFTMDYDLLKARTEIPKDRTISVISSSKTHIEGQRIRLAFAEGLKERFKDKIDFFGRGLNEVEDKWDALAPYKYHIAIENAVQPHYWTEKLSDAYLAMAYPIYYGCPNLKDYFPEGSYTAIDITDFEGSVEAIERTIAAKKYESAIEKLREARNLCLDKYNLFPMIDSFVGNNADQNASDAKVKVCIKPENSFGALKRKLGGLYDKIRR